MSQERSEVAAAVQKLFGRDDDPIAEVAGRASAYDASAIVWQGDPQTFAFDFVSPSAERILGYPASRWTKEATFWADIVVHPEDRDDAIAYCALATGRSRDHTFEYRAIRSDGSVVWLVDFVRVVLGARSVPVRLRGIMLDVTEKREQHAAGTAPLRDPPRAALEHT